jgi:hypothetical protein
VQSDSRHGRCKIGCLRCKPILVSYWSFPSFRKIATRFFHPSSHESSKAKPKLFPLRRPGKLHPSKSTHDKIYDCNGANRGLAVIFNHVKFEKEDTRLGSDKDAADLEAVLNNLGFQVQVHKDKKRDEIRTILIECKCKFSIIKNH